LLQVCCSENRKTEGFRRERRQFAADSLQIQQTGRGPPGFLRLSSRLDPAPAAGTAGAASIAASIAGSAARRRICFDASATRSSDD